MNQIQQTIRAIVEREFKGETSYPLAARQCLHWAEANRPEILDTFLPDLEQILRAKGNTTSADQIGDLSRQLHTAVGSAEM
jgi:hypothetical protein